MIAFPSPHFLLEYRVNLDVVVKLAFSFTTPSHLLGCGHRRECENLVR